MAGCSVWIYKRLCLALLVVVCVLSRGLLASMIIVTPPGNQAVPKTSQDNVTFICNVTGSASSGAAVGPTDRDAIWEVLGQQIPNDVGTSRVRDNFASVGVFTRVIESGVTELIITSGARNVYQQESITLVVRCVAAFPGTPPTSELGDMLSVSTYGPPSAPTGLSLDPASPDDLTELVFSWKAPTQQPVGVDITYQPVITGLSINLTNTTQLTSVTFTDTASLDCRPHNFSVTASNLAGTSPPMVIERTIPISPDLRAVDEGFIITQVSLTSPITLSITVPLATTCSEVFRIQNYSLSSVTLGLVPPVVLGNGSSLGVEVIRVVEVLGLNKDVEVDVYVEVCISITCKNSTTQRLRTSDTQNATVVFFENNVQLTCTFAANFSGLGCRFQLSVGNVTETYDLLRGGDGEGTMVTQCNQTSNQGDIYNTVTVTDIEATGDQGILVLLLTPDPRADASSYTSTTSCSIPQPTSALSTGGVVGIVVAAVVLGVALLVVVIVVVVYRVRTGQWFKIIKDKDEDGLTVHFEKELLMADSKPKKKSKVGAFSSAAGHNSPDLALQGEMVYTTSASSPPSSPIQMSAMEAGMSPGSSATAPPSVTSHSLATTGGDGSIIVGGGTKVGGVSSSATAPLLSSAAPMGGHAFTLDISADHKKVKLRLNRALIKQKLAENNLKTMDRKKPHLHRQMSQRKLSLNCQMIVEAPNEDKPKQTA